MKKTTYPWRPLLVPTLLGLVTAFGLLTALLSDGLLEIVAVTSLAGVVGLVIARFFHPLKRR
jgi:hypothetical protein